MRCLTSPILSTRRRPPPLLQAWPTSANGSSLQCPGFLPRRTRQGKGHLSSRSEAGRTSPLNPSRPAPLLASGAAARGSSLDSSVVDAPLSPSGSIASDADVLSLSSWSGEGATSTGSKGMTPALAHAMMRSTSLKTLPTTNPPSSGLCSGALWLGWPEASSVVRGDSTSKPAAAASSGLPDGIAAGSLADAQQRATSPGPASMAGSGADAP
mmetsp:Transcript_17682/g.48073  ORF Transcript_17682/g.48073 Transcript_17682/m.48073 type:complete len:212 (-) Transcript_17682:209-844(-)